MSRQICICSCPLTDNIAEVMKALNKDELLVNYANDHREILIKDDVEIFEQISNILITSSGYYAALFSNDLNIVE